MKKQTAPKQFRLKISKDLSGAEPFVEFLVLFLPVLDQG
jgi:hypothetical protein